MAEKRVSVRLVAEGGRQVRAELEGIGDAGARGFGRLSTEMELANTRLASFARKAGLALAAVTVAAAAAGVAMVRSGLETIGAQADLAASLKTTVESLQVLAWAGELAGVSMGEIEQATKKLTTRLSEAAAGSGSAVGALQRLNLTAAQLQALPLDQRIVTIQEALNRFVPEAERAAVASDLFGDKAALAFLRIDPATLREAAQDVRDFGVAVSAADAAQIERTGDAIAKLSMIWLGLTNRLTAAVAPALETIANTLSDMARSTGPIGIAINALFDNIGRLTTYAATFATLMAGRWVAGLAAAALSVRGLATGLVILRSALIRTGIGALIVGAGELVFQFTRLVAGAGGFGAAIGLLKDLALEVWDRISLGAASAWSKIEASWAGLQATIYGAMQSSVEAVTSFGNSAAGTLLGGANALAVETGAGQWEIVQAGVAELIAPGRYRLTRLLRGQRGTEGVVAGMVASGARVVVLDTTVAPLPINEADLGLPWNWRIGPASKPVSDETFVATTFTPEGAGLRPFSVAHVEQPWRTAHSPGDLTIRWTRRSRSLAADTWGAGDVPLAEDSEAYEVEIHDGSTVTRTLTTTTASVLYTAAQQTADWGAPLGPGQSLAIRIYQLSALIGRGAGRSVTLSF